MEEWRRNPKIEKKSKSGRAYWFGTVTLEIAFKINANDDGIKEGYQSGTLMGYTGEGKEDRRAQSTKKQVCSSSAGRSSMIDHEIYHHWQESFSFDNYIRKAVLLDQSEHTTIDRQLIERRKAPSTKIIGQFTLIYYKLLMARGAGTIVIGNIKGVDAETNNAVNAEIKYKHGMQ
ncbi:hypothetical protein L1987_61309 [Smallanthus sonchifolius]|uniref:Uncharacterized protein n=1 Tax=Smallanthus sonchifolius TaxID=185202 RepID=A0ACB9DAF9_9ASTR|nr:hypothetical protein L1987_61309 [Smallanthus sonchifolius]